MENTKNITINNSTVNFYDRDLVAEARDELLRRLFYARHKDTIGGYDNWLTLLDHYYCEESRQVMRVIDRIRNSRSKEEYN